MTSGLYKAHDAAAANGDNGAVHVNDGVGNKTAYLISQGGSFNGQTSPASTPATRGSPRPACST